ncbi:MAG: DUF4365 domain-containing protein [Chloroflexi bacterium]|nr:DUF4365 domain-containing protein [Chloroflexota bacterium]
MDSNTRKERFSLAYIGAVASHADCEVVEPKVDRGSVDGMLKRASITELIGFQAKATSRDLISSSADHINFPLPVTDYDNLRNAGRPFILVVVLLPDKESQWLSQSNEELCLRYCGYWLSLEGRSGVTNTSTVTVRLPLANRFGSVQLGTLMDRAASGSSL